jgi:hypothetical protein
MRGNTGLNNVTSRLRNCCTLAGLVVLTAVISVGCGERENWLEAERPTEVRLIEESSPSPGAASTGVEPGKVLATLKPGEAARVVAVYHGQDSDGFKVKLADGTEGLIMASDAFKVVSR